MLVCLNTDREFGVSYLIVNFISFNYFSANIIGFSHHRSLCGR